MFYKGYCSTLVKIPRVSGQARRWRRFYFHSNVSQRGRCVFEKLYFIIIDTQRPLQETLLRTNYTNFIVNIFGLLSLAGLAISIAALGTELGYQSKLVKQVCGTVGNGGCEKVLGSRFAKGIAGITPADASVLYFAAQFILYLVGCIYNPVLSGIITIAFAGIAVAAWSIYTQAVKLKDWCALCLAIVAVLLGQAAIATSHLLSNNLTILTPNPQFLITFTQFLITSLLLTLTYLPIKQLIKKLSSNKQELASFKKWKTDANLFIAQWQNEHTCDNTLWENDLLIGNPKAPIRITVACNPYCGPCAKAHTDLDKLVDKYGDKVCVQIRLLCNPTDAVDKRTIAVRAILQQTTIIKNNHELQTMLSDWFEWMDFEKWAIKWNNKIDIDVTNRLTKHKEWNELAGITHTPTLFINGKKIPGRYNINDIEKMIPQLQDAFEVV